MVLKIPHLSQNVSALMQGVTLAILITAFSYFAVVTNAQNAHIAQNAIDQQKQIAAIVQSTHDELAARAVAIAARFCEVGKLTTYGHNPQTKADARALGMLCAPPLP